MTMSALRPAPLREFLEAAAAAYAARATGPEAARSVAACLDALDQTAGPIDPRPQGRAIIDTHLPEILRRACETAPDLARLADGLAAISPLLAWGPRSGDAATSSPGFAEAHANAMIVGPGGLERRTDVWLGASIMAPGTRYPDHSHPPEETYLVLSSGRFWHQGADWVEPGIGGTFHNPPGILHAMQAGTAPFLAFWLLRAGPVTETFHASPT